MMGGHKHVVCLCLFTLLAAVHGGPSEYDLQQFCNTTIDTFSSALLKINGWWFANNCTVRIHADHSYNSQVRLEVLHIKAPCQSFRITLQDGSGFGTNTKPRTISRPLCDDTWRLQTMYLTTTDTLTITLQYSGSLDPTPDYTVTLLATSTSLVSETGDFRCDNLFEIISTLKCDGYNNCGDSSDERSDVCEWELRVGLISGSCAIILIIIVIAVVVIVRRRRRLRTSLGGRISSKAGGGEREPPSYSSLQGRENPGYKVSPPLFNTSNVTMPPPANP